MSYTEITINGNKYEVIIIAKDKGTYGDVYFGKKFGDTEDNRAFKFLKPNKHDIESVFDMETVLFKELTEKISQGCKKYIIDLKDFGTAIVNGEKKYIVVMEKPKDFITIQQYIDDTKTDKNVDNVTKIYTEMLKGIYCINSSGFVHCDIKPANIMVHTTSYEIKYIDFGGLVKDGSKCITQTQGYFIHTDSSKEEQYYNGARDLYAIGKTISNIFNNTQEFDNSLKDPFPKLTLLSSKDLIKKKVIDLQKFYRTVCEDEYIEIGELKKDKTRNDIYFINKNGYKTFVETDIKKEFPELYYDNSI
jgi:serine/threonine protein kinase